MTTPTTLDAVGPRLLDARAVARMLGCSWRHVYRLSDGGRMPPPIKLGALVRWDYDTLARWIANRCPPVRQAGRATQ
jgi:predicted DNA-binding transcriptional regulator AlpA